MLLVAKDGDLLLCLLKPCEDIVIGFLLAKARAASGVGKALKLPDPPRLTILLPVDFLPLVWKVFLLVCDVKNLAAPDGGLLNTLLVLLKPEEPPDSPKVEEPWLEAIGCRDTVVTRVTGSFVIEDEAWVPPCLKKTAEFCPELPRMPCSPRAV